MDAQLTEFVTSCIEVEKVSCCPQYAHDHNARMPTPTRLSIRRLRNSEAIEPALRFPGTTITYAQMSAEIGRIELTEVEEDSSPHSPSLLTLYPRIASTKFASKQDGTSLGNLPKATASYRIHIRLIKNGRSRHGRGDQKGVQ
jgi:hypothetical protein